MDELNWNGNILYDRFQTIVSVSKAFLYSYHIKYLPIFYSLAFNLGITKMKNIDSMANENIFGVI